MGEDKNVSMDVAIQRWINVLDKEARRGGLDDAWKKAASTQNQPAQQSLEAPRQGRDGCTQEKANCGETEDILKPLDLSLPRDNQVQTKSSTKGVLRNYLLNNPAINSTAPRVTVPVRAIITTATPFKSHDNIEMTTSQQFPPTFKGTAATRGVINNTSTGSASIGSAPGRAIIVTKTPFRSHGNTKITTPQQIPPAFKGTAVTGGVTNKPSSGTSTTTRIQSKASMQDLCANKSFMVPLCSPAPGVFMGVRPWKGLPAPSTPEDRLIFENICKGSFPTTPCVPNDGDKARHRTGYIWISPNKQTWYCEDAIRKNQWLLTNGRAGNYILYIR
ncbi:hypothetical protein QAD02_012888 [Eretmocerus hayati]|uniref:Uncharacterized protein n=1 Tax=Eretmocerus hayati TaxID=131215 RepID=A0ACC2P205_9HYME|nr:hypothetical protein QAD02_012888 [Eretmocerus hayati]